MDSSPDLSLKLRRGSSDSRDNFYMDFAQGIDSDIEEVDNSVPPPPPPPSATTSAVSATMAVAGSSVSAIGTLSEEVLMMCPPPLMSTMAMPLPTLTESDDLPPTPPPMLHELQQQQQASQDLSSPLVSPTTSVLELIPPPPLSPSMDVTDVEDEDERADAVDASQEGRGAPPAKIAKGDDDDVAEQKNDDDDDDDDDDDEKSTPPPPLPPLPLNLSYVHGSGNMLPDSGTKIVTPPHTKSPSTSPSPPVTPPPCPQLGITKIVSPPATHVSQIPPLTPPSESDQSQPNSPPPLMKQHSAGSAGTASRAVVASPPLSACTISSGAGVGTGTGTGTGTVTAELNRELANALAAASISQEQLPPPEAPISSKQLLQDEYNRSLDNEDESTTITTPPSNGYSASSIIAPPPEHFAELDDDGGIMLANIPPPAGLEDDDDDDNGVEGDADDEREEDEDEDAGDECDDGGEEATKIDTDEISIEKIPTDRVPLTVDRTPIQIAPSGSPSKPDSRAPSRSVSRSGSVSNASRSGSRSGSVRGSIGSRAGSIAAGSLASVSAAGATGVGGSGVLSPQASIKSVKSPALSIKSKHSAASSIVLGSMSAAERMQSPPLAESAPVMPSPPLMRSSPPELAKSPPRMMHSPPRITSPPRVYSPPLVSSPLIRTAAAAATALAAPVQTADEQLGAQQQQQQPASSTGIDSAAAAATTSEGSVLPTTTTEAAAATGATVTIPLTTAPATTTLSYQDEQTKSIGIATTSLAQQQQQQPPQPHVVRPHLTSHHHYHLPHQFQHPHHQNHHTHSVRVPTPTVPAAYQQQHYHYPGAGGGNGGPPSSRRDNGESATSRYAEHAAAHTLIAPAPIALLATPGESVTASVSPLKLTARLRDSGSQHHVTIDESNLPHKSDDDERTIIGGGGGGGNGDGDNGGDGSVPSSSPESSLPHLANLDEVSSERQTGHLALMYHSHQLTNYPVLPAIKRTHRPSFIYPPMPRVKAGDALATLFSALYGKLLVVMGIAFPMAEVISTYIPPSFYEVYYLYLYIGSMIFLLFMYATLLWGRPKLPPTIMSPTKSSKARSASTDSLDETDTDSTSTHRKQMPPVIPLRRPSLLSPLGRQHHYGSFYLRMGAVAFGIGSMIYSGLEFGQYFELNPDTKCHNVLLALTPATRMAFIFIQMYFIFLNNEQIKVYRYKIIARFGLMHMIGTNLAVWLNVLIQETKHEILTFYNPENRTLRISHRIPGHSRGHTAVLATSDSTAHLRLPRGLKGPYQIFECRRTNIIGTLVQDASPFLFPCTIEYSLICAAILYVMWRSISRPQHPSPQRPDQMISSPMKRSPHHYSVDCARAHKGLFVGILVLVLTIISLILFFVLISRPDFVALAVTEVTICELLIYGTATIATLVGMFQIRHLQYDAYRSFSLDDILLVGAQTGSFLYNIFTVIAGHFTLHRDDMLVPINALASIVQTACQTMFILDASRRQAVSPDHIRKKPGREIVTFMLVVNLAMWAISTLEKSRAESHPIQLNFYGLWAWTIITHVSMPLAIFYRFHSTVCLCEIWKRAYKLKPTYM